MQIYGKESQFDAARLVDLLGAYESFKVASTSARGSMDATGLLDAISATALPQGTAPGRYEPGSALHQVRNAVHAAVCALPDVMPAMLIALLTLPCCTANRRLPISEAYWKHARSLMISCMAAQGPRCVLGTLYAPVYQAMGQVVYLGCHSYMPGRSRAGILGGRSPATSTMQSHSSQPASCQRASLERPC